MNYCKNETIRLYQGHGKNLADLLHEAATVIDNNDDATWANLTTRIDTEEWPWEYEVNLYLHS